MSHAYHCPKCRATFAPGQVPPGTEFTCGACGGTVVAPRADAYPSIEQRYGLRRSRSSATLPWILAAGLLVATGAVLWWLQQTAQEAREANQAAAEAAIREAKAKVAAPDAPKSALQEVQDPIAAAGRVIAGMHAGTPKTDVRAVFDLYLRLDREAEAWKERGAPEAAVAAFRDAAMKAEIKVLALDPDFDHLRKLRREHKYTGEVMDFADSGFLAPEDERAAQALHKQLVPKAADNGGWLPAEGQAELDAFYAKHTESLAAFRALRDTEFGQGCSAMYSQTRMLVSGRFSDVSDAARPRFDLRPIPPYCFVIQRRAGRDSSETAKKYFEHLNAVHDTILHEFGDELDLKPLAGPVHVMVFRDRQTYWKYCSYGKDNAPLSEAHFETNHESPKDVRLVLHEECDYNTIRHEGTHQLFWEWEPHPRGRSGFADSYWFGEGIAEWYGGAKRERDPATGKWRYELGFIHPDRMMSLKLIDKAKRFDLWSLISTPRADFSVVAREGRMGLVYAQSWFLIYFLNFYSRDESGAIRNDQPGKWRTKWRDYVKNELQGRTGDRLFMECLGIDLPGLKAMEKEYWEFYEWLVARAKAKK